MDGGICFNAAALDVSLEEGQARAGGTTVTRHHYCVLSGQASKPQQPVGNRTMGWDSTCGYDPIEPELEPT